MFVMALRTPITYKRPLTIGALGVGIVSLSLRPAAACSDRNRRVGPAGGTTRRVRCRTRRSTRSGALGVGDTMHVGYRRGGAKCKQHKGKHQYSLDNSSHRSCSFRIGHFPFTTTVWSPLTVCSQAGNLGRPENQGWSLPLVKMGSCFLDHPAQEIATWPDLVIAGRVLQPDYDLRDLRLPPPESPSARASSATSADAALSNCSSTVSRERI